MTSGNCDFQLINLANVEKGSDAIAFVDEADSSSLEETVALAPVTSFRLVRRPQSRASRIGPRILIAVPVACLVAILVVALYDAVAEAPKQIPDSTSFGLLVTDVWNVSFPKLLTESSLRTVDVNKDGIKDVILGFATGGDGYSSPEIVCDIYFDGQHPCFGGILCVDGATGQLLWKTYTKHEIFALNCNEDLDADGVYDCIAGGRAGVLVAVSGRRGTLIWVFPTPPDDLGNFYTPQFFHDLNRDRIPEVLISHGGDPLRAPDQPVRNYGTILVLCGRTGNVIRNMTVPDRSETYNSPQVYTQMEGVEMVLFGTGGENHGGSLWAVSLEHLVDGDMHRARRLIFDPYKGVMAPPVLADINGDHVADIVIALFNSSVIALDGLDFHELWRYTTPDSETYSTPAAGFFNNDLIPDFFVKYMIGPGYPVYYHSESTVLDGASGKPILASPVIDMIGSQSSPLTVSLENNHDLFLYWIANCTKVSDQGVNFVFSRGTKTFQKSRSDFCKQRFESEGYSRLYAMSYPGIDEGVLIYDSVLSHALETGALQDTATLGRNFLLTHPEWQTNSTRRKRHIGAHDSEGIQRLISTGTLADSFPTDGTGKSIDIVFATYLFYPLQSLVLLPEDQTCVEETLLLGQHQESQKDSTERQQEAEKECVARRTGVTAQESESFRDLFQLRMGAMTVYRKRLQCLSAGRRFLPSGNQGWGAYMGTMGDSIFRGIR